MLHQPIFLLYYLPFYPRCKIRARLMFLQYLALLKKVLLLRHKKVNILKNGCYSVLLLRFLL